MGAGKTQSAITMMNEDSSRRYIFVTPYLDEVERIIRSCPERNFIEPDGEAISKLTSMHSLLKDRRNIATTHKLFSYFNEKTAELIKAGGYTLVLDEVFCVVEQIYLNKSDIDILFGYNMVRVCDNGKVEWLATDYKGGKFQDVMDIAQSGNLFCHNNVMLFWMVPAETFKSFEDVYILTYMFDAQMQRCYYDMKGVEYKYIGTAKKDGVYRFSDIPEIPEYVKSLKDKIHILEKDKVNDVGDRKSSLSSSWYSDASSTKGKPKLEQIRKNIYNVFRWKFGSAPNDAIWTTFKDHRKVVAPGGYKKSFLSSNARATNQYSDRHYLAYCINKYFNPFMKNYFLMMGVRIEEDGYALSEMVQWIWRSAIRNGEDIWIYVPSKRMRTLLKDWLERVGGSDGK